jgi:hypothetical protein
MAPFHFGGQWRVCDVESPKQDGPVVLLAHPIWLSASGTQCVESMAWRVSSEESLLHLSFVLSCFSGMHSLIPASLSLPSLASSVFVYLSAAFFLSLLKETEPINAGECPPL